MLLSRASAPRSICPVLDSSTVVPPTDPIQPPLSFLARPRFEAIEAKFEPPPSNAPKPPEIPCDNVRAYGLMKSLIKFVPMSFSAVFKDFVLPIKKLKNPSSTVFDILETVSAQEFLMSLKEFLAIFDPVKKAFSSIFKSLSSCSLVIFLPSSKIRFWYFFSSSAFLICHAFSLSPMAV